MKKIVIFALAGITAAVLALSLCACGPQGPEGQQTASGIKESDMFVEIGGVRITTGGTAGDLLGALKAAGIEPDFAEEAESCLFDGKDVTYHFAFGEVFAFPQKSGEPVDANIVDEIYVTASDNANAKGGIKVGATEAEVKEAFGDSCFTDGARLIYTVSADPAGKDADKLIYFYIEYGAVTGIGVLENLYHPAG